MDRRRFSAQATTSFQSGRNGWTRKTLVTTPNSDVIYAMSYVDLGKDGPLVFEAPPGLQGILLDFWQRPIPVDGGKFFGDVGLPGPDAGKGGKFLLLPPGYKDVVPSGFYVYRSATNNVFVFLRAFYRDPQNLALAVSLVEQSKIYLLNGKGTSKNVWLGAQLLSVVLYWLGVIGVLLNVRKMTQQDT